MKILHIAPNSVYVDYWGYQDNLLPKYHKKLGYDVSVIVPNRIYKDGKLVCVQSDDYYLNDGVRVIRLEIKKYFLNILTNIRTKMDVIKYLKEINPDFIFFHGLISSTILDVIKYKKKYNPNCIIVQDNHSDYYNAVKEVKSFKQKILRWYYRHLNKKTLPYVSKVYGVTPWRKTYAEDYFKIKQSKTDVLIMGADDEYVDLKNKNNIRDKIRKQYDIKDDDFLIVTGGKIDKAKNILNLMQAINGKENVKLLVFGSLLEDAKQEFNDILSKSKNVIYIGWIDSNKVYDYFFSADLVCFPGTHSVLWEQACACKVPCLFKRWEGMEHVNNGGNSDFIDDVSSDGIRLKIEELLFTEKYYKMKEHAESEKTDIYLYSNIAKKSLESYNANK